MKKLILFLSIVLLTSITYILNACNNPTQAGTKETANESISLWGHTEPGQNLQMQYKSLNQLLNDNPLIKGVTIKVRWKLIHPTEDHFNLEGLAKMIELCTEKGIEVGFELQPGWWTPDWVMAKGVDNIGPMAIGNGKIEKCPMVWDKTYKKYLKKDLQLIANLVKRYPNVKTITIMGHNYKGAEMHVAKVNDIMISKGFSEEMVLKEWEDWMDFYATAFSDKKMMLCISQTYTPALPAKIVALFISKYKKRAELNNCQLDGRQDMAAQGALIHTIMKNYPDVPISFEMVGSFMEQPERQGSYEMTVYNARTAGQTCYFRLWRRDLNDICYADNLIKAWDKYKDLTTEEFKAKLIEEGLYKNKSTWKRPAKK